jgi:hypothetical protein
MVMTRTTAKKPSTYEGRLSHVQTTRHLAVTQDGAIIGVSSVSNILRYYSGVV